MNDKAAERYAFLVGQIKELADCISSDSEDCAAARAAIARAKGE